MIRIIVHQRTLITIFILILLSGNLTWWAKPAMASAPSINSAPSPVSVNQTGYLPDASKHGILAVTDPAALNWELLSMSTGQVSCYGQTSTGRYDPATRQTTVVADFTSCITPGQYVLRIGSDLSHEFTIGSDIYTQLSVDSLRYFYLNRSGIALEPQFAGEWARSAGHLSDNAVSCATCPYELDVSGGWNDAGDYNKYVVNAGISTWALLNLYERLPDAFPDGSLNIPESGNGVSDILDEVRWELDWMMKMQVPAGYPQAGMVHHMMRTIEPGIIPQIPPEWYDNDSDFSHSNRGRYLTEPGTAATYNLAANAAQCARIWQSIDPVFASRCLDAARTAFNAAFTSAPRLITSGYYTDTTLTDEQFWAASELYITTGEQIYLDVMQLTPQYLNEFMMTWNNTAFSWRAVGAAGVLSLMLHDVSLPGNSRSNLESQVIRLSDEYINRQNANGYRANITYYWWGSNSDVLHNAIVLAHAHTLTDDQKYLNALTESLDYLLGRNGLSFSFVSGYGETSLRHPHHSFWADEGNFPGPPPGAITGGPNEFPDDPAANSQIPSNTGPALMYVDDRVSWSTNEVAINYNAPLAWAVTYANVIGGEQIIDTPAPNVPPVIQPVLTQTIIAGEPFNLAISAADANTDDTLSFDATGLPDGLNIDPQTGTINGATTLIGTYAIIVAVMDSSNASAQSDFTLIVEAPVAINVPPVIQPILTQSMTAGETLTIPVNAHDADGDTLSFNAAGLIDGLSIDAQTGTISGIVNTTGQYPITVVVTDSDNASAATDFILIVEEVSSPNLAVTQLVLVNTDTTEDILILTDGMHVNLYTLSVSNISVRADVAGTPGSVLFRNGNTLLKTENILPYVISGDSVDTYNVWNYTPGRYDMTVTPYTGGQGAGNPGESLMLSFTLVNESPAPVVTPSPVPEVPVENNPPVINNPGAVCSNVNQPITPLQLTATDNSPGGETLVYILGAAPNYGDSTLPTGLHNTMGVISGVPTVTGIYTVRVEARDTVNRTAYPFIHFNWTISADCNSGVPVTPPPVNPTPPVQPDIPTLPLPAECAGLTGQPYTVVEGSERADTLQGTEGNDLILGYGGKDTIYGNGGNDCILGGNGKDTIYGGTGNDIISGGKGVDTISGDDGHDILYGNEAGDIIFGGNGDDVIDGGNGSDILNGDEGNDTINGGVGHDELSGGNGNDVLSGGNGADVLSGGAGDDNLNGGNGNDILNGENGNDVLTGSGGEDRFNGGADYDTDTDYRYSPDISCVDVEDDCGAPLAATNVEVAPPVLPTAPVASPIPPVTENDADWDGIADDVDTCPSEGDWGLGLSADGCPYKDTDGDTVLDHLDICPNQGDQYGNGIDADGCPLP